MNKSRFAIRIAHNTANIAIFFTLLSIVGTQPAFTQSVDVSADEEISIQTRLVSVTVQASKALRTSTDADLRQLRIFADETHQATTFVTNTEYANVALVVDVSMSMKGRKSARTRKAVEIFLEEADPRNRYTLVTFNGVTKQHGEFSGDAEGRKQLLNALSKESAGGETILYDACLAARSVIAGMSRTEGKKALVVFTDGLDTRSKATIDNLNRGLNQLGGLVYVLVLGNGVAREPIFASTPDPLLDRMTEELATLMHAEGFPARSQVTLFRASEQVANRLKNAIQLGFYPQVQAAMTGTHRIKVTDSQGKVLHSRTHYVID